MEKVLFTQHTQHFKQEETTPMAQPYLAQKFGTYAETEFEVQYQEGKGNIEALETDKYTREFLTELQCQPSDPPTIGTHIDETT
eukprot:13046991-Ditylum_brightwellii.AAC.1